MRTIFKGLTAVAFFALCALVPVQAKADSCPADEHDGVRVQGCQIGDDIQVLVHNNNTYDVSVDVIVTYREKSGAIRSNSFHGEVSAGSGGELGLIPVRPYYTLSEVTDVTLKDVTQD
jgi:hypothetical protein